MYQSTSSWSSLSFCVNLIFSFIRSLFLCEISYSTLLITQDYLLVNIFLIGSLFLCEFDCFLDQVSLSQCFVLLTVLLLCAHEYTRATHSFFPHTNIHSQEMMFHTCDTWHMQTRACVTFPLFDWPSSTRKFQKILLLWKIHKIFSSLAVAKEFFYYH